MGSRPKPRLVDLTESGQNTKPVYSMHPHQRTLPGFEQAVTDGGA